MRLYDYDLWAIAITFGVSVMSVCPFICFCLSRLSGFGQQPHSRPCPVELRRIYIQLSMRPPSALKALSAHSDDIFGHISFRGGLLDASSNLYERICPKCPSVGQSVYLSVVIFAINELKHMTTR